MTIKEKKSLEHLYTFIKQYMSLSSENEHIIKNNVTVLSVKPRENFIEVGDVANKIGFLIEGVVRFFFYNESGKEITSQFLIENDFVTNINSFYEYAPNTGTFQAETKCTIIVINREAWDLFCKDIPNWSQVMTKLNNTHLIQRSKFQRRLINEKANVRYDLFTKQFPTVMNNAHLGHISSFLGINQSTLSRIRKEVK